MEEVDAGATEDIEVEVMFMAMSVALVDEEDMLEGSMVTTYMNLLTGMEHLWQRLVHTLHTNGGSSTSNKK